MRELNITIPEEQLVMAGNGDGSVTYLVPVDINGERFLVTYDRLQHYSMEFEAAAARAWLSSKTTNGL